MLFIGLMKYYLIHFVPIDSLFFTRLFIGMSTLVVNFTFALLSTKNCFYGDM